MAFSIQASANIETNRPAFFERNFNTREEFQAVANLCDNKKRIGLFESLVIPIRTDNINNFCTDFFFPTFIHHALLIKNIALKIICSLALMTLDICTLPIRLITVIPRYIYNAAHSRETHPLYQYLIRNGVAQANLSVDSIFLELTEEEQEGQVRNLITRGDTFNFIQLPETVTPIKHLYSRGGIS